jgi:hypothetical protein
MLDSCPPQASILSFWLLLLLCALLPRLFFSFPGIGIGISVNWGLLSGGAGGLLGWHVLQRQY